MPSSRDSRPNWNCCEWLGNSTKSGNKNCVERKISMPNVPARRSSSNSVATKKSNSENKPELTNRQYLEFLSNARQTLNKSFQHLPKFKNAVCGSNRLDAVLNATAVRLRDNYPYFHPLYAGQLLQPPHPKPQPPSALPITRHP